MTLAPDQIAETAAREWRPYPEYKESGVEWLGEVPAHWRLERLKNAVSSVVEKRPNEVRSLVAQEHIGSETGTLRQDVEIEEIEIRDHVLFESGDILFGKLRPYLRKYWLASFEGACPTELLVLRPKTRGLDRRFLFYSVQSEYFIALSESTSYGVKMPRTSWESLSVCSLTMPSLQEQQAIASFLDRETEKIDSLIAKRQRLIELLEEKKTALISRAVTKGLDPDVPMKDSGIEWMGKIPDHWGLKRVKHLTERIVAGPFGSSLTKDLYTSSGYRVYGQEQIIPANFSIGDYYISEEKYEKMKRYAVYPGDVLVSCVGTFGKIAVVPEDAEPGIINPRLARLVPTGKIIESEYLGFVLKSRIAFDQMEQMSRGGTMGVINLGLVSEVLLPVPSKAEQAIILDHLNRSASSIDALGDKLQEHIDKLREYRTALISAAVTGKIDVRDEVSSLEAAEDKIGVGEGIGHEDRLA